MQNNFKVLEAIKPMSLNRIVKLAKVTYSRKEEDIRFTYGKIKPILLICIRPPYWIKMDVIVVLSNERLKKQKRPCWSFIKPGLNFWVLFSPNTLKVVQTNFWYHTQYIGSSWSISYFDTIFLSFPKKNLKIWFKKW